mgnify:CR=1 FL=1
MAAAKKPKDIIKTISADELVKTLSSKTNIIDVRRESEFDADHLESAKNLPLDYTND